jgi:hypothetical protein
MEYRQTTDKQAPLEAQDATEIFECLKAALKSLLYHTNEFLGRQRFVFRDISTTRFALKPTTGGDGVGVELVDASFIFTYRSGGFVPAAKARDRWFRLIKRENVRFALSARPDQARRAGHNRSNGTTYRRAAIPATSRSIVDV